MALVFPANEREKRVELEALMRNWANAVAPQSFTPDGFYPYYWNQPIRILVVGRESRGVNSDYIDCLLNDGYWVSKIGGMPINRNIVQRRLMYVVYGIIKEHPSFDALPTAAEIGKTIGKEGGISFAWMNISKITNHSDDDYRTNYDTLRQSYNASGKFIADEVEQLAPHVIVTMNVGDMLVKSLSDNDKAEITRENTTSQWIKGVYTLGFKAKRCQKAILIDTYHFAAHSTKSLKGFGDKNSFYDPICSTAINFIKTSRCL